MPSRLKRRLISLPVLFGLDLLTILLSPVLLMLALAMDVVTGIRRRRFLRLVALWICGLAIETAGVLASVVLWVAGGFGLLTHTKWQQHLYCRLQIWWGSKLLGATARIFSTSYQITGLENVAPGPVVVAARHISHGDALLPSYVVGNLAGLDLRHVLKKELAWGPAIDLVGHRQRNHFVTRAGGQIEATRITKVVQGLGPHEAAVIFPEGTFFTPERQARVVKRLRKRSPQLAAQAETFKHLLPPRPGGTLALLKGAPDADLVFLTHVGFEPFSSIRDIIRNVPFDHPVEIEVWRVPRSNIPEDPDACTQFLFDWWERMDSWVDLKQSPADASATSRWRKPKTADGAQIVPLGAPGSG